MYMWNRSVYAVDFHVLKLKQRAMTLSRASGYIYLLTSINYGNCLRPYSQHSGVQGAWSDAMRLQSSNT